MDQETPRVGSWAGKAIGGAAVLGAATLAWSALAVDHRMRLPVAISARREVFQSPTAGNISFYLDAGRGGRPLLLLHSVHPTASAREVEPLFDYFRGEAPLYALDLPGFGFSTRVRRDYSPAFFVNALIEFVESRIAPPLGGADIVALGLTSEFAALAGLRRPELFRSFVFLSPSGFGDPVPGWSGAGFPLWSQALFDLLVSRPAIHRYFRRSFAGEVPRDLVNYAFLTAHQPGARYAPLAYLAGQLSSAGIVSVYSRLAAHVLTIAGQEGEPAFAAIRDFVEEHPKWRWSRVAHSGNYPHFENLPGAVAVLTAFWRSLREPPAVHWGKRPGL